MVSPLLRTICSIVCTSAHVHLLSVLAPLILRAALLLLLRHLSLFSDFSNAQVQVVSGWQGIAMVRGVKVVSILEAPEALFVFLRWRLKTNSLYRKLNLDLSLRFNGSAPSSGCRWSASCLCFWVIRWYFLRTRGGALPPSLYNWLRGGVLHTTCYLRHVPFEGNIAKLRVHTIKPYWTYIFDLWVTHCQFNGSHYVGASSPPRICQLW